MDGETESPSAAPRPPVVYYDGTSSRRHLVTLAIIERQGYQVAAAGRAVVVDNRRPRRRRRTFGLTVHFAQSSRTRTPLHRDRRRGPRQSRWPGRPLRRL